MTKNKKRGKAVKEYTLDNGGKIRISEEKSLDSFKSLSSLPYPIDFQSLNPSSHPLLREGATVIISKLQIVGTIISRVGKDLTILDQIGYLHYLKDHEVYPEQNS